MNAIFSPISALSSQPGPALTWYSPNLNISTVSRREELGGPVVARWLSKIANLLGTDLADLFGSGEARSIEINLPGTWQEQVWILAAALMGWKLHPTPAAHEPSDNPPSDYHTLAEVYVTNTVCPRAQSYLDAGCDVLFHATTPLALSWHEQLPPGGSDAIEAIMSQPDLLVVDLAESPCLPDSYSLASCHPLLSDAEASFVPSPALTSLLSEAGARLLLSDSTPALTYLLATLWGNGGSAVVVAGASSTEERERIAAVERCTLVPDFPSV